MAAENVVPEHFNNEDDILDEFVDLDVRPFMQSTVVAAPYDNNFFDPSKGNSTYFINRLSDDAIISSWEILKPILKSGKISPKHILSIIELAANVKSAESSDYLLSWVPRDKSVILSTSELSDNQLLTNKISQLIEKKVATSDDYDLPGDEEDDGPAIKDDDHSLKAKAACYLSLCVLRLMKKDPASFAKGIGSIQRGFSQFYDTSSSEVLKFEINKASIIAISDGLRSNAKLGQTMIYCVATGMKPLSRTSQDYHLMRFSFCQHVELKGLHAYKLFYELDKVFNERLPTAVFLSWLTNDTTYKAVMQIYEIIKNYDNEKKTDEYLWLYARYLNNGYFYDLHTARCKWLVYVLGTLSKSQIPVVNESAGSPLDLMELKKMTKAQMITAKEYAEIFEENYTKLTSASSKMNRIQREFQKRRGLSTAKPMNKRKMQDDDVEMEEPAVKRQSVHHHSTSSGGFQEPSYPPSVNIFATHTRERSRSPPPDRRNRDQGESDDDGAPLHTI